MIRRMHRPGRGRGRRYARRTADRLHDGIEHMADRGERLERHLRSGCRRIHHDARAASSVLGTFVQDRPLLALGSSAAAGFLIGLACRMRH